MHTWVGIKSKRGGLHATYEWRVKEKAYDYSTDVGMDLG